MGQRETPARVQAVLLPPRPAAARSLPRAEPASAGVAPSSERTLLRAKERESAVPVAPAEVAPVEAPAAELTLADPASLDAVEESAVEESPVLTEAGATPVADASTVEEPARAPATSEPPRRSPSVPVLPVVALERPTASSQSEPTPSPVPRVSLMPPTGRIDASQLLDLGPFE